MLFTEVETCPNQKCSFRENRKNSAKTALKEGFSYSDIRLTYGKEIADEVSLQRED